MRRLKDTVPESAASYSSWSDAGPSSGICLLVSGPNGDVGSKMYSVSRLADLGLSARDFAELDLGEPLTSEIMEYARASGGGMEAVLDAVRIVLNWHVQDIDREIEMLSIRRRMLKKALSTARRLACALSEPEACTPAA